MIDPQEQAKWVKNMERTTAEAARSSRATSAHARERDPVWAAGALQEVEEDSTRAEPNASRAIVKVGNRSIMKLGDKEVDYNPEFRFYLTTKLANPHYTPEILTKATICNFCVKQQGLEDQLGTVAQGAPRAREQKNDVVVAAGKRKLVELEDTILGCCRTGSLLDDEELVLTLQSLEDDVLEVTSQLQVSEQTERRLTPREGYRPWRTVRRSSTCSPSTRCTSSPSTPT